MPEPRVPTINDYLAAARLGPEAVEELIARRQRELGPTPAPKAATPSAPTTPKPRQGGLGL